MKGIISANPYILKSPRKGQGLWLSQALNLEPNNLHSIVRSMASAFLLQ